MRFGSEPGTGLVYRLSVQNLNPIRIVVRVAHLKPFPDNANVHVVLLVLLMRPAMKTEGRPAVTTIASAGSEADGCWVRYGCVRQHGTKRSQRLSGASTSGAGRFERSVEAMATRQRLEDILTTHEIAGLELFVDPSNCTQCHNLLAALWRRRRGPVVQQPPGYLVIRSRPCLINHPFR